MRGKGKKSKPEEVGEKKPINQFILDVGALEQWVDSLSFYLTLFLMIDVTVGNQEGMYSRGLILDTPEQTVTVHLEAIQGYIYDIVNKRPLSIEIPIPLYCLLLPACDYEINSDHGRITCHYEIPQSWALRPEPAHRALFGKSGYYAMKFSWKHYTTTSYLTKQGKYKDIMYMTGKYTKEANPVELLERRMPMDNYQFIDLGNIGILGHSLRGSELNKELVMGHLRVLPVPIVRASSGRLTKILPVYFPAKFQHDGDRPLRAVDVLLQGGPRSIMGVVGALDLAVNPDLTEAGAMAFVKAICDSPVEALPSSVTNLPHPVGIAASIVGAWMASVPHHVYRSLESIQGFNIKRNEYATMCSSLARKRVGDNHLPLNIADSVSAHRTVFALDSTRLGAETGFIHQRPLLDVDRKNTSTEYGDAFNVAMTIIATGAGNKVLEPISGRVYYLEVAAKRISELCQQMHNVLVSAPILSADVMNTPLSSKVMVGGYVDSSLRSWEHTIHTSYLTDEDFSEVNPRIATALTERLQKSTGDKRDGWELFSSDKAEDTGHLKTSSEGGKLHIGEGLEMTGADTKVAIKTSFTPKYVQDTISNLYKRKRDDKKTLRLFSKHARLLNQAGEVHFFSNLYIFPLIGGLEGDTLGNSNYEAVGFEQVGMENGDLRAGWAMGSIAAPGRDEPSNMHMKMIKEIGKYAGFGSLFSKALNIGKSFLGSDTGKQLLGKGIGMAMDAAGNSDNKFLRGAAGVLGQLVV